MSLKAPHLTAVAGTEMRKVWFIILMLLHGYCLQNLNSVLTLQNGFSQCLEVQDESCCGVSLVGWGQGRAVRFRAHSLVKGEKQSVRADKLQSGVHTDKYMYIYGCEISKQAYKNKQSNACGLIRSYIYF